jgi:hypothetical protein
LKKKFSIIIIATVFTCLAMTSTALAETKTVILKVGNPYMTVNGTSQEIDPGRGTVPIIVASRTLVPVRTIIEQMNGSITWNGNEQLVTISTVSKTIKIWIGNKSAQLKDSSTGDVWSTNTLDVPARSINGRTMVPLRFVTEALGASVGYDGPTKTITLSFTPAAVAQLGWTGTWNSNWGTMTLVQTGSSVTGNYTHDSGKISGTVSGNKLVGTWSESPSYSAPNDAGDVELTLSSDENSFTGSWRYGSSGSWDGSWTGTKVQ